MIAAAVPDPADRLDLAALDHPLDGMRHTSAASFQEATRAYITADLTAGTIPGTARTSPSSSDCSPCTAS